MQRKLVLKHETLTELSHDQLGSVAGGTHVGCGVTHGTSFEVVCPTMPLSPCLSLDRPCIQTR